jgi:hypothetical protein
VGVAYGAGPTAFGWLLSGESPRLAEFLHLTEP